MRQRLEHPAPSATAILLREGGEGSAGLEMLLVQRNRRLDFHGGAWVFPGGRIDPGDRAGADPEDPIEPARRAAVREIREEAGLAVVAETLVPFARWTTPEGVHKRFETWFFAAELRTSHAVRVDGGEILAHRWISPRDALAARAAGEIELPGPTFVCATRLTAFERPADAVAAFAEAEPEIFLPRLHQVPGGLCSVYQADASYRDGDLERPGARHRLWMLDDGWRYERRL